MSPSAQAKNAPKAPSTCSSARMNAAPSASPPRNEMVRSMLAVTSFCCVGASVSSLLQLFVVVVVGGAAASEGEGSSAAACSCFCFCSCSSSITAASVVTVGASVSVCDAPISCVTTARAVGLADETSVAALGEAEGAKLGTALGKPLMAAGVGALLEGANVEAADGDEVSSFVRLWASSAVNIVGAVVGLALGELLGCREGAAVGEALGTSVGAWVGGRVGAWWWGAVGGNES
jgi:hypothetical protein